MPDGSEAGEINDVALREKNLYPGLFPVDSPCRDNSRICNARPRLPGLGRWKIEIRYSIVPVIV